MTTAWQERLAMRAIASRERTIVKLVRLLSTQTTEELRRKLGTQEPTPYARLAIQRILRARGAN